MHVVIFAVELHKFSFKILAYSIEYPAHGVQDSSSEYSATIFRHKDQMHVQIKHTVPSMPDFVIDFAHRPIIIRSMKTLKLRLKDKHAKVLNAMAREVNFVWNYVNELSLKHTQRTGKFFSAYDIDKYTSGATKEGLLISSTTVQSVSAELVTRRKQFKKAKLRWRVSNGSRRSLGWVPFKANAIAYKNGQLRYAGHYFSLWDSYGLANYEIGTGSFNQDSRGRWYANVTIKTEKTQSEATKSIGIDLGLNNFAATSDGEKIVAQKIYRGAEAELAKAQRANKKKRVKAIHAKIANRRKDFLHKLSTRLVSENGAIFVGNVNASGLAKTNMAKSVLDASWSTFRTMLRYKCDNASVLFEEVNEAYSTQTCSACNNRTGPKGREGLRISEWTCMDCGTTHDRDVNAGRNICHRGHAVLAVGIPCL